MARGDARRAGATDSVMSWRNSRAGRIGVLVLEAIGVAAAVACGLVAFLLWRIEQGPTEIGIVARAAEYGIERALPAKHDAHVRRAVATRDRKASAYLVTLENVAVVGPGRTRVADLSRIELVFAPEDLLRGRFGPRSIVVVDPFLRIVRGTDRRLSLDYSEGRPGAEPARNVFRLLTGERWSGAFERAELRGARLHFADVASGRTWKATNAAASIRKSAAGYEADIVGAFDISGKPAALKAHATYVEKAGRVDATVDVRDAPVGDILDMFYGEDAAILTAPVSGTASITLTRAGEVVSSSIRGRSGAGELLFRGARRPVTSVEVDARFDPKTNRFDVANLAFDADGSRGTFSGVVGLVVDGGDRRPDTLLVDVVGRDVTLDTKGVFAAPLALSRLSLSGAYDVDRRGFDVSRFSLATAGVEAKGALKFAPQAPPGEGPAPSPEIRADVTVDGALDPATLAALWPVAAAQGAREFVATRVTAGKVSGVRATIALPPGAVGAGAPFPKDSVRVSFAVADASVVYAPGMTPLSGASGEGSIVDDTLLIRVPAARVGRIALSDGEVDFTSFKRNAPVHFRFTASGGAREIMTVLDQKPLSLLRESRLDAARFAGDARLAVDIMRPNRREVARENYVVNGSADFRNLAIAELYKGADLEGGAGGIRIAANVMNVKATGKLGGAPVTFDWTERFFARGKGSRFSLEGTADSRTADVFGVPTRQVVRGPVRFKAAAEGNPANIRALKLDFDFIDSTLIFSALGWTKPAGVAAVAAVDARLSPQGTDIRALSVSGAGVDIRGAARLDSQGVVEAAFPTFRVDGAADLVLGAARGEGGSLRWTVGGRYLNAGPLIEEIVGGRSRKDEPKLSLGVDGHVDRFDARAGASYRNVDLRLQQTRGVVDAMSLTATTAAGATLAVATQEGSRGRRFVARSQDVGALMTGIFGVTSIRGGDGQLTIDMGELDADVPRLKGDFAARDVRVVDAPLLARVFAAGSLTGLVDLLNNEGIAIDRASGAFEFHRGVLTVDDARASGPSVGLTAQGVMTAGGGPVELTGAVAPAYQVKSLLGQAPVIGPLLVGRPGEGVVALSYDVKGRSDAPIVTVDPLSALAPGIFRRLFEMDRTPQDEPSTPPVAEPR